MTLNGFPTFKVQGSTSLVTTEPAPIIAPLPILTPFKIIELNPIQTSSSIKISMMCYIFKNQSGQVF